MSARILFLKHPGQNSRDIFSDVIEGYSQAGHEVFILELGPLWARHSACESAGTQEELVALFADTVLAFAQANRIDFAVSLWANGHFWLGQHDGKSFFEHVGLPVLLHWLDAPQWAHSGKILGLPSELFNGPNTRHLVNNLGTAQEMESVLKFENVMALSNAASPRSFRPRLDQKQEFDIVFGVGADVIRPTELMLDQLQSDEPDVRAIRADVARSLSSQLCHLVTPAWKGRPGGAERFVELMIEARLEQRDEPVLNQVGELAHRELDLAPGILSLLEDAHRYVQFSMTLREMESWERAFTFTYLSRHFQCATFGGKEPFKHWPGQWEHLGWLSYQEQARAYSSGRFGLNVMRWQDDLGLNLKPFEITLSGVCLLQSYRLGIEEHFDDQEIVSFRTPQQCRARVEELLADPRRRERIATAGRARSLRQHCWRHRAAEVARVLAGTPSPTLAPLATNSELAGDELPATRPQAATHRESTVPAV